jgi:polysaccharide biosynthesis/export protein
MMYLLLAALLASPLPAVAPRPRPTPARPTPAVATPTAAPTVAPTPDVPQSTEYRVGAGDVLEIIVIGDTEFSRPAAVVQTNGTITLSHVGEVGVASLTVAEIKAKLTRLLERDYLVRPQLEVKIKEYSSQFVHVMGHVNSPGKKPLRGQTVLSDILIEAGSFTTQASGEVHISRVDGTFSGGEKLLRVRLNTSAPTGQDLISLQIPLRHGDLITVLPKYHVFVDGEVARAGRYVLESDLTVNGLISIAGGLTRWGKSDVKIIRRQDPTKEATVIKVNLKDIQKGKKPDVPLEPNDQVVVGRRLF